MSNRPPSIPSQTDDYNTRVDKVLARLSEAGDTLIEMQYYGRSLALMLALRAFNPDQPRVPAGRPDGGQWAHVASASSGRSRVDNSDAADLDGPQADGVSAGQDRLNDSPSPDDAPPPDVELVNYQGYLHDKIRDELADLFRKKGFPTATEVPVTLIGTAPLTARIDILVRDPTLGLVGFEVKTGFDPTYTIAQSIVYPHLPSGGLAFSSSPKILQFGIAPMQTLPPIMMFTFDYNVLTGTNKLIPIIPERLPKKFDTYMVHNSECKFRM